MTLIGLGKVAVVAIAGISVSVGTAVADFPSETIRLIVPYKPGGGSDSIGRAFAAALEEVSGQAVVVENIPGSAGINGMMALKKSKPDGHTIAINGSSDVSAPIAFRDNAPFAVTDFACAGGVFNTPVWVLSHTDNGYSDLGDFLEDAKANPGTLTMGITGKLSATDFVASTVKGVSGLDFRVVSFGGGGPLKKAILANQVDVGVIISPVLLAEVEAGELNALAAAGDMAGITHEPARQTPHIRKWGAGIDVALVRGIFMPEGVSDEVRARMEELVTASIESETFSKFASNFGFAAHAETGADFCARLPKEVDDLQTVLSEYLER